MKKLTGYRVLGDGVGGDEEGENMKGIRACVFFLYELQNEMMRKWRSNLTEAVRKEGR